MKKKLLVALVLAVVFALSLTTLGACDSKVTAIKLVDGSLKTEYVVGDPVDLTGAKIKVSFADETDAEIALTADMLDNAIDTSKIGSTKYTISYNGLSYQFTVKVKGIDEVELVAGSLKLEYLVGETVDMSNAKAKISYSDGTEEQIALTADMLNAPVSTAAAGNVEYTISYKGVTGKFTVKVIQVESIQVVADSFRANYILGDELDFANAKLTINYSDNSSKQVAITSDMLDKAVSVSAAGSTTYTVSHSGKTTQFTIVVKEVQSIAVKEGSLKAEYVEGAVVSYENAKLVVTYTDNSTDEIALVESMLNAPISTAAAGENDYIATYYKKTVTIHVTVITLEASKVQSVAVKANSVKTEYVIDDTPTLQGALLTVTFNDGTAPQDMPITAEMLDKAISTSAVGSTNYTVTYLGYTAQFTVVVKGVKSIALVQGSLALKYKAGTTVDLQGAKIHVVYTDDSSADIALEQSMLNKAIDTSASQVGDSSYTISYKGQTADITVTVITIKSIELVSGSLQLEYVTNDNVNLDAARITVVYTDNSQEEIALLASMLNEAISTATVGIKQYTITYSEAGVTKETTFSIDVVAPDADFAIQSFELPEFYALSRETAATADTNVTDATFRIADAIYEIGNANAFIFQPVIKGQTSGVEQVKAENVKTTATFRIGTPANSESAEIVYRTLAADEIATYVSVNNNVYRFTEEAANKYFEIRISLNTRYYYVSEGVETLRSITVKVLDNGYNVYDQDGLSVMNDYTLPSFWADIWGCVVNADGTLSDGANPLQLAADDKPLYQYVGQVDWIVLHGKITLDADKLPEGYFWDQTREGYCADNWATAVGSYTKYDIVKDQVLQGTLIAGNGQGNEGHGNYFTTVYNYGDDNYNRALYQTNKVNISGNYNTIEVPNERSTVHNRLLKVLVGKVNGTKADYWQECQWHLFKMIEGNYDIPFIDGDEDTRGNPIHDFVMRNLAVKGNCGRSETVEPTGLSFVNLHSKTFTAENVVINSFFTGLTQDNWGSASEDDNKLFLTDSKIFDIHNAMAFTWRGKTYIKHSILDSAGGPLFVQADGDGRSYAENPADDRNVPYIDVDSTSTLTAYAQGNENWYTQLGTLVPLLFNQLRTMDMGLWQISGKTAFFTRPGGSDTYASIWSMMLPESGTAMGDDDFNKYKTTGKFILYGLDNSVVDITDMRDPVMRQVTDALWSMDKGTLVFKSGSAYAFIWNVYTPGKEEGETGKTSQSLISLEMLQKAMALITNPAQAVASGIPADYLTADGAINAGCSAYTTDMQAMGVDWHLHSTNMLTLWLQATMDVGDPHCPYLGIVLGGYHTATAPGQ